MNVVESIVINAKYEEEFRACEEMDALARSNQAKAGALPKKDKPAAGGLKRTTPLKAHAVAPTGQGGTWNGLKRRTPLKAKTPLQSKPAEGDGSTWNGMKRNSTLRKPLSCGQGGEFDAERQTSRTGLKAKSTLKPYRKQRHYGHLVKNGWCACCGKGTLETEWHHIIYRSHGGDESDENMLEVCRDCHEKIHAGEIGKDEVAFARLTAGSYLEENQRVIGARA